MSGGSNNQLSGTLERKESATSENPTQMGKSIFGSSMQHDSPPHNDQNYNDISSP